MNPPNITPGNWSIGGRVKGAGTAWREIVTDGLTFQPSIVGTAMVPDAQAIAALPQCLTALNAMRDAYGRLHDILNDCIERGAITGTEMPEDYDAIVEQLSGPCNNADHEAHNALLAAGYTEGGVAPGITCTCHLKSEVVGPVPHCCPDCDGDYSSFLALNNCD